MKDADQNNPSEYDDGYVKIPNAIFFSGAIILIAFLGWMAWQSGGIQWQFKMPESKEEAIAAQTAIDEAEVDPNSLFTDARQPSAYAEISKYYTEATEVDAGAGAWPDLAARIENALSDGALSNKEYYDLKMRHVLVKEAQARQLLIDDSAGKAVKIDGVDEWIINPAVVLNPYQQILKSKVAVEGMMADPANIRFIEKIRAALDDGEINYEEYQDLTSSYNVIRATEDKITLLASLRKEVQPPT